MLKLSRCLLCILVVLGSVPAVSGWAEVLAPGVEYTTYSAPGPNDVYVVSIERSRPEYKLRMGLAQKKRNFTAHETARTIASRYDSPPNHDVLAAVNGSRFNWDGIGITGYVADGGNYIQPQYSERETCIYTDAHWLQINRSVSTQGGTITFADDSTLAAQQCNFTEAADTITVYTPIWDTSTRTTFQGTEVILSDVSYPMRPNKNVSGVVTAVRTGAQSLNNAIPAGGMVISANGTDAATLAASAVVGQRISVRFHSGQGNYNNAQLMITGLGWILKDGAAYTSNWTHYGSGDTGRNPRLLLAWNATHTFLVIVDGRQTQSVGMSFQEEADFLLGTLHATDAINLDGGGSATMVVNGQLKNSPSDGAERALADSIMVIKEPTPTTFPLEDAFGPGGRTLPWDDKRTYNPITAFSPTSPGGDGYVMMVRNTTTGIGMETTHVGSLIDADYTVESDIYCEYRPGIGSNYERYGIFARDNGNFAFTSTSFGGGAAYAMIYEAGTGQVHACKLVGGAVTDFPSSSIYFTSSGWHNMRIECAGRNIRYYIDDVLMCSAGDDTYERGFAGIGWGTSYSNSLANKHGTRADNFRMTANPPGLGAAQIRQVPVGSYAEFSEALVTASLPASDIFYVQQGTMSIGVLKTAAVTLLPTAGQKVHIGGPTVWAAAPYSSEVVVSPIEYSIVSGTGEPTIYGAIGRAAGGEVFGCQPGFYDDVAAGLLSTGLNLTGSLVRIWGTLTAGGAPGQRYCWIDDGSRLNDGLAQGVRVDLSELGNTLPAGTFYVVTGILRPLDSETPDSKPVRVICPRSSGDVIPIL